MRRICFVLFIAVLGSGCTVNQDLLFRTTAEQEFAQLNEATNEAYTLAPNDRLQLQLFSNRGQLLMSVTAGSSEGRQNNNFMQQQQRNAFTYRVELDGTVELPEVGAVQLAGLTLDEAERKIEDAYEAEYVEPYALLRVVNNRVLVFPGEAGQATVITLENQNTTVIEVLAQAGAFAHVAAPNDRTHPPKGDENLVFLMDLSTVDGLEAARRRASQRHHLRGFQPSDRKGGAGGRVPIGPNDHHDQFSVFDLPSVVKPELMELQTTPIDGLLLLRPRVFEDERGAFSETWNQRVFDEATGEAVRFVQANESVSKAGVLRGLHFQAPPHAQGKLVRVVRGRVLDVAVDLRFGSPTYGQHHAALLSGENRWQFYVPPGLPMGLALEDDTVFLQCTALYHPDSEQALVGRSIWASIGE